MNTQTAPEGAAQAQQEQTGGEQAGETSQRRREIRETLESLRQGYADGTISEDDFDEAIEAIMEAEGLADESMLEQYSFGGRNASAADLDALNRAKELERQGVAMDTIFRETGWYTGADGKWRFEIDDSGMEYSRWGDLRREDRAEFARFRELEGKFIEGSITMDEQNELRQLLEEGHGAGRAEEQQALRLPDFLRHDELYQNYPKLRQAGLRFTRLPKGTRGTFDGQDIVLDESLRRAPEDTLVHEIQHAIQRAEGFTGGASPESWQAVRQQVIDTVAGARQNLDLWLQDIGYPEYVRESMNRVVSGEITLDEHWKALEEFKKDSPFAAEIARCEEELANYENQLRMLNNLGDGEWGNSFDMYENTAGEIEARDVTARRQLTPEQRRETMPNTGDERTVFAETMQELGSEYGMWDALPEKRQFSMSEDSRLDSGGRGDYDESISEEEWGALLDYKSSGSYQLNAALRDGTLSREQRRQVEALDRGLEKLPVYRGMVYRRLGFDSIGGQGALDAFLAEHQPGEIVGYPAYTSTSTSREGYTLDGDLTVTLVMESGAGRDLAGYGNNFESEVLFPRNRNFLVERVESDERGKPVIYMREVNENGIEGSGGQLYPEERGQTVQPVQQEEELHRNVQNVSGRDPEEGAVQQRVPGLRAEGDGDGGPEGLSLPTLPEGEVQYSISEERDERRRIAGDLRSILDQGGSARDLRDYVDSLELGAAFRSTVEQDTDTAAREIIREAHGQGIGVEEYLRRNWERYEYDGELNQDAQRALEVERQENRQVRRYSIQDEERVFVTPAGVEVVQNPTDQEYQQMKDEAYQDYPWLRGTGEPMLRLTYDQDGNQYYWRADQAMHAQVEPYINDRYGTRTSQQWQWWTREDADSWPVQYSLDQEAQQPVDADQLPTLEEYDQRVVDQLPAKARTYLNRAENKLLEKMGAALSVPRSVQRDDLKSMVRRISAEYLNTGTIRDDMLDELFDEAYSRGVVVDRAFYDENKDLRDFLRGRKIVIDERDANDIPDFNAFRQSMFGRLNLSTKGRANIEDVYRELNERWPEYFNEKAQSHPSDMLLKITDVLNSFQITERTLDQQYGANAEEFRRYAKNDFLAAVRDTLADYKAIRNYAQERERSKAQQIQTPQTQEEVTKMWGEVKAARKQYEKAAARNLLTQRDEMLIGQLLRGETEVQQLNQETENVKGILEVYAAKREYDRLITAIKVWNQSRRAGLREQADGILQNALDWKDKKAGILYSRETMERNIRDIVPDEDTAQRVIDTYFTPVHRAAADANRLKNGYRDRVRELKLSRKTAKGNQVSEAHAVQLLGEAEDNIRVLEQSQGRVKERDGKSLEDWRGVVRELWEQNPNLDQGKIRNAVQEFREIYDELFKQMNEVRVRNGYEPVNYRRGYFPHFQPGEGDGIMQLMGKALGIGTEVTALPTSINGLTHTFRPGIRWFGNAQQRMGFNTAYDAVEGFDRYIEGVADVICQTDNIQRLRALATQIRYRTGDESIRRQIDDIRANPNLAEEDKQNRIQKILENGRYTLSNFVVELDEYTNLLANKKSRADRNMEQALGRRMYNVVKGLEGRVAANMVAVNPASWLTNFIPLTQAWAGVDSASMMKGMWQTLQAYKQDDGMVARSAFLTNRRGSDPLVRTWAQGASAAASRPMEWIDSFVADSIVRARYNQNLSKGMSEANAVDEADSFAANVMADRSKGATPTLFNRSNPITKVFTQFQLEVNNQLSYLFKDLMRETKKKSIAALAAALLKFALGAFIFDEIYEYIIGRRPALDPVGILNDTVGDLTGYELPNLVELGVGAVSGNVPSFQVEQAGLTQAGSNLASNVAESLPFVGGLLGGGRVPIQSAIPSFGNLWNAFTAPDWSMKKRLQEVRDELLEKPVTYLAVPFGGGQLKKIFEAIEGVIQGGSYSINAQGEQELQYPIYNENFADVVQSGLIAGVFGRTALPTGRDWVESGFSSLSARQTAAYQGMVEVGVEQRTAYTLIQELRDAEKIGDKSQTTVQREILENAEISADGKAVAYYGLLAADSEREIMDALEEQGAESGEVARVLMEIKDAGALGGTAGSVAKREAILNASLSQDEKLYLYRNMISDSRDEEIQQVRDSGLNVDDYILAQNKLDELKEEGLTGDKRNDEFYYWVDRQGWSQVQADAVKGAFTAYDPETGAGGGYYNEFTVAGLPDDTAKSLSEQLDQLQPEAGEESVSEWQEAQAVIDSGISEDLQMQALGIVMDESGYDKLVAGYNYGLQPRSYIHYKETIGSYDLDGSGRIAQEEAEAAIDSMLGLTNTERAILWQLQQKNWKAYNNPYDTAVGQWIYDALHAAEGTESQTGGLQPIGTGTNERTLSRLGLPELD